jgi:chromosome segregation ATPase
MKTRQSQSHEDLVQQTEKLEKQFQEIEQKLNTLDSKIFREEADTSFVLSELSELETLVEDLRKQHYRGMFGLNEKIETISRIISTLISRQKQIDQTIQSLETETICAYHSELENIQTKHKCVSTRERSTQDQ